MLLYPGSRFRHHFLLAGAVVLNFVASGANQTPILAYVIFCRQAQWLRHVVFKTPALTIENPSFFRCRFLMAGAVLQRSLCQKSYAHHRKRGHQKQGGWLEELCAGVGFLSKAFSKFTLGSSWTHLGSSCPDRGCTWGSRSCLGPILAEIGPGGDLLGGLSGTLWGLSGTLGDSLGALGDSPGALGDSLETLGDSLGALGDSLGLSGGSLGTLSGLSGTLWGLSGGSGGLSGSSRGLSGDSLGALGSSLGTLWGLSGDSLSGTLKTTSPRLS